jgi:hypothetical protein
MFNSKIASLEARIARLEAHLTKTARLKKAMYSPEEEYMGELKDFLEDAWAESGARFKLMGLNIIGTIHAVDADVKILFGNQFLKIVVTGPYNQKKTTEVGAGDFEDVHAALMECVSELHG